jgi:hypothetical protein
MPNPSLWPIGLAASIVVGAVGGLTQSLPVALLGGALIFICVFGWAFQPLER